MHWRRNRNKNVIFAFNSFDITRQELIASITIIAIMLMIGFFLSGKISDYQQDKNEIYNKASKINQSDIFDYGMRTNIGNAFVYGELNAVDTVNYPELENEYIWVEKIKERYTMHTRTVTRTVNGKTTSHVETYWTWDRVGSESKSAERIEFCSVVFDISKISLPGAAYITTIKESSNIRYKYYGIDTHYIGTIFADLRNGTIPNGTSFYQMNIEETYDYLTFHDGPIIIFWICWLVLIGILVYGFYYLDNRWLE